MAALAALASACLAFLAARSAFFASRLALASSILAALVSAFTLGAATGVSFAASAVLVAAGAAAVAVAAGAAGFAAGACADAANAEITKAVAMRDCFNIETFRCMAKLPCALNPAQATPVYPALVNLCKARSGPKSPSTWPKAMWAMHPVSCAFGPSPSSSGCSAICRVPVQPRPQAGVPPGNAPSKSENWPTHARRGWHSRRPRSGLWVETRVAFSGTFGFKSTVPPMLTKRFDGSVAGAQAAFGPATS